MEFGANILWALFSFHDLHSQEVDLNFETRKFRFLNVSLEASRIVYLKERHH